MKQEAEDMQAVGDDNADIEQSGGGSDPKGEKKGTLVYKFGLPFGPVTHENLVEQQFFLAWRYRMLLTLMLINPKRDKLRRLELQNAPFKAAQDEVKETAKHLAKCRKEVKEARRTASAPKGGKKAVKTRQVSQEMLDRVKDAQRLAEQAKDRLKAVKSQPGFDKEKEDRKLKRDNADLEDNKKHRLLREESSKSGLYWGTSQLVDAAVSQANGKVPLFDSEAEPKDPRYPARTLRGQLGVQPQIQYNINANTIFEPNVLVWIDPVDERAWYGEPKSERRRYARTVLHLRVESEKAKPIFADFPMIMHRPFPEKGRIVKVVVNRGSIGPRTVWSVDFSIATDQCPKPPKSTGPRVAMNIGWRAIDEGLRVGTFLDDEGNVEFAVVDRHIIDGIAHVQKLRSTRDKLLDEIKVNLSRWIKANADKLPEEFRRKTHSRKTGMCTVALWKSGQRLSNLCVWWKTHRFAGDTSGEQDLDQWKQQCRDKLRPMTPSSLQGFAAAEAWRYTEHHLWTWERNLHLKLLRRRKEQFRLLSRRMADKYGELVLHEIDLSKMAKRLAVEESEGDSDAARSNRFVAAASELRECLVQAFRKAGKVAWLKSENITQTCSFCGMEEHFDAAPRIEHVCSHCGKKWDQDINACRNLLFRHTECVEQGTVARVKTKRKKKDNGRLPGETRWEFARRKHQEKVARVAQAKAEGIDLEI